MIWSRFSSAAALVVRTTFPFVVPASSRRSGAMPQAPTIQAARGGRALDVAADASRVLAVEDPLGGHGSERPDQLRDLLRAPGAEALLLLARLVVAEGGSAPTRSRAAFDSAPFM